MKTILDPECALANGLAAIREQYRLPAAFAPEIVAAAERTAARRPDAHTDRTDIPFVTLDPASSTDLDQAFHIERGGNDLLLHYAIADVAFFVDDGDALDHEAWKRGASQYLPDGKVSLYPPILSEGAASLLPGVDRPAVLFTVRVDPAGEVALDAVERVLIRSRAKLAYETAADRDLPEGFADIAARIALAEDRRRAARVEPPEQEVVRTEWGYRLQFRPRAASEDRNATLSLATNLAVADALRRHRTGLFRIMPGPDARAEGQLRRTAEALGLDWPRMATLQQFERMLNPADARDAAFMVALRRAGSGASYEPFVPGKLPWHAAIGAPYAHATAPLRRLADRYVIRAALAIANGRPVSMELGGMFEALPPVMARADALGGQIDRAVVDLAEAVVLQGREGDRFSAVVTDVDERGARIQLSGEPVVARLAQDGLEPGTALDVVLAEADPMHRRVRFDPAEIKAGAAAQ